MNWTKLAIGTVCLIPLAALNGLAIQTLWGWFVVPVFALATLPLVSAIGIALLIQFSTGRAYPDETDYWQGIITAFSRPVVAIAFGYLYLVIFS